MNIVCVAGGSYKSFYINYLLKLKECDLLVFNFDIIYPYVVKEEILGTSVVTKELMALFDRLKCPIVAGVMVVTNERSFPAIMVCENGKIYYTSTQQGAKIYLNDQSFRIGTNRTLYAGENRIVLSRQRIYPNVYNCSKKKLYLFCDRYGVSIVRGKNLQRKFHKYSKIILK